MNEFGLLGVAAAVFFYLFFTWGNCEWSRHQTEAFFRDIQVGPSLTTKGTTIST